MGEKQEEGLTEEEIKEFAEWQKKIDDLHEDYWGNTNHEWVILCCPDCGYEWVPNPLNWKKPWAIDTKKGVILPCPSCLHRIYVKDELLEDIISLNTNWKKIRNMAARFKEGRQFLKIWKDTRDFLDKEGLL